ncbi:MAG TPA: TSUP family transporter, partial [Planctomycetota bacterium]|nr:TSUP family transporter [Planctomycetota bacterium]
SPLKAALFSIATGFATYIANATSPVMNLYLLSIALPKSKFMGTGAQFFFVINLVKIPQFALQNRITADTLWIDLWLAPAVILGALLGRWLFTRIPQAVFEKIIICLALLATITLFLR